LCAVLGKEEDVRRIIVAAASGALLLTACTPAAEPDARAAAEQFQRAIADRDLATACGMLSDQTRQQLEGTTASRCGQALSRLDLPDGAVTSMSVWGDNAQARWADGALFLAEFRTGWRVTAAGCTFVGVDLPYDCDVKG
jgi:hypothetical protein